MAKRPKNEENDLGVHLRQLDLQATAWLETGVSAVRPDRIAWVILALASVGAARDRLDALRSLLEKSQLQDGRVPISPNQPQAYWPTALAVLAWHGSESAREAQKRGVAFLLAAKGRSFPKSSSPEMAHDTSIEGWTWVAGTHSWVEPTAMALLALRLSGHVEHGRAREAVRLLLDRQLPSGGWNYGNTMVFGNELRPLPLATGLALCALEGLESREAVQDSVDYLERETAHLSTPLSLAWGILGLGAWGRRPEVAGTRIIDCLHRQEQLGAYDPEAISLLVLAFQADGGLLPLLSGQET